MLNTAAMLLKYQRGSAASNSALFRACLARNRAFVDSFHLERVWRMNAKRVSRVNRELVAAAVARVFVQFPIRCSTRTIIGRMSAVAHAATNPR